MKLINKILQLTLFTLLFYVELSGQNHQIFTSGYVSAGYSIGITYSYNFYELFFLAPNYSLTLTRNESNIFSFSNYSVDLGINVRQNDRVRMYVSLGPSFTHFITQKKEGNPRLIYLPNQTIAFTHESKADCLGLNSKIGIIGELKEWLVIGMEMKYFLLFPEVRYNYKPEEYSTNEGIKRTGIFFFGVILGVQF